jgi:predicted RNase H-like nuclease (RuvC/YqgF family)
MMHLLLAAAATLPADQATTHSLYNSWIAIASILSPICLGWCIRQARALRKSEKQNARLAARAQVSRSRLVAIEARAQKYAQETRADSLKVLLDTLALRDRERLELQDTVSQLKRDNETFKTAYNGTISELASLKTQLESTLSENRELVKKVSDVLAKNKYLQDLAETQAKTIKSQERRIQALEAASKTAEPQL